MGGAAASLGPASRAVCLVFSILLLLLPAMASDAKVHVDGVPYDLTEAQLRRIMERAGPIVSFELLKTHFDRENSGSAWVTYGMPADAQNAVRLLNGFHVNNHALKVSIGDKRRE